VRFFSELCVQSKCVSENMQSVVMQRRAVVLVALLAVGRAAGEPSSHANDGIDEDSRDDHDVEEGARAAIAAAIDTTKSEIERFVRANPPTHTHSVHAATHPCARSLASFFPVTFPASMHAWSASAIFLSAFGQLLTCSPSPFSLRAPNEKSSSCLEACMTCSMTV
jgi:hypothetical protein